MQDEIVIDPRKYILIVKRYLKWIIGASVLAAIALFMVDLLYPSQFEATALVAVTRPRYVLNFDPRFETVNNIQQQSNKAFIDLATSDEIVNTLFSSWKNRPSSIRTSEDLKRIITAGPGSDASLVKLSVRLPDPKEAESLSNLWAAHFLTKAKEVYGGQGDPQVQFISEQLDNSKTELQKAEDSLTSFQGTNTSGILANLLNSTLQTQSEYLSKKRNLEYSSLDLLAFKNQLAKQPMTNKALLADQISLLYLNNRVFNSIISSPLTGSSGLTNPDARLNSENASSSQSSMPFQLQYNTTEGMTQVTTGDLVAQLNQLEQVIQTQAKEADSRLESLSSEILDLQEQLQEMDTKVSALIRARDITKETYTTLARKMDEIRITNQDSGGEIRLATKAMVPDIPLSRHRVRNAAIAGGITFLLGVLLAIAIDWLWANPFETDQPRQSSSPIDRTPGSQTR